MAVFRVERNKGYTVMSNYHLKDRGLTLKSKGLLSMTLSLPDEWNYTTRGLAAICREGVDSIGAALRELEKAGYIVRNQLRDEKGRISSIIVCAPHAVDTLPRISAAMLATQSSAAGRPNTPNLIVHTLVRRTGAPRPLVSAAAESSSPILTQETISGTIRYSSSSAGLPPPKRMPRILMASPMAPYSSLTVGKIGTSLIWV